MKTLKIAAVILVLISNYACSQKEEVKETSNTSEVKETPEVASKSSVPKNIATAFANKFANATEVTWGKENENEYEAEFKLDGRAYSANYDTDGNWLETEFPIKKEEIPAKVNDAIAKDYMDYKIDESEKSETKNGIAYEFELTKEKVRLEVAFDVNGKELNKQDISNEDKSND